MARALLLRPASLMAIYKAALTATRAGGVINISPGRVGLGLGRSSLSTIQGAPASLWLIFSIF